MAKVALHLIGPTCKTAPLSVGTMAGTGQQYAVVADQKLDQVGVYDRIPGTNQFNSPIPISTTTQPLLAPGAVQLFSVPGDPDAYMVVANSLSNNVLVYHANDAGQFGDPTAYTVGFDPVSVTIADLNGDGIPDMLVANYGSNDVSVLLGSLKDNLWTATNYQRLKFGGSGPVAVAVRNANSPHGPDLLITDSDGKVIAVPGIGAAGKGSGFFQDNHPQTIDLRIPLRQAVNGQNGQFFVVGADGSVSVLGENGFATVIPNGVATLDEVGSFLVAGFDNGTIGVLSTKGALLESQSTGFADEPSALAVLQNDTGLDVYVTQTGSNVPIFESFPIPILTQLPASAVGQSAQQLVAQGTGLAGADLIYVAFLVPGAVADQPPAAQGLPRQDVFAPFVPPQQVLTERPGEIPEEGLALAFAYETETPGWESYPLGAGEALGRFVYRPPANDGPGEFLDTLPDANPDANHGSPNLIDGPMCRGAGVDIQV